MATYTFRDENTGEVTEHIMPISEHDAFTKANPHLKQVPMPVATISRYHGQSGTNLKPAEGFREVLRGIKANHKGSTVDTF